MSYHPKLKTLALTLWNLADRQPFPPLLEKMFWNTGRLSTYDITDDLIHYPPHQIILSEWKYFLQFARASSLSHSVKSENLVESTDLATDFTKIWNDCTDHASIEMICHDYAQNFENADAVFQHLKAQEEIDHLNGKILKSTTIEDDILLQVFDHYYRRADYSTCSQVLQKMASAPSTWETEERLAHFFHVLENQEEAQQHLIASINLGSPRPHRCLTTMGLIATCHSHHRNLQRGISLFDSALEKLALTRMPGEALAYERAVITNARALSLYHLHGFDKGLSELARSIDALNTTHGPAQQQFLALLHDSSAVIEMAYREKGWERRVQAHFQRVLEIYPKYYRYHLNMADFEDICGEYRTSLSHLEAARNLSPSSIDVKERLVNSYEKLEMYEEANVLLSELITSHSKKMFNYEDKLKMNRALLGDVDAYKYICTKYPGVSE